jgi:hypothetical protein
MRNREAEEKFHENEWRLHFSYLKSEIFVFKLYQVLRT